MLRLRVQGQPLPADRPAALPLATLTAARPHLALLSRLGLRTWGEVHALPRAPMVRRFGPRAAPRARHRLGPGARGLPPGSRCPIRFRPVAGIARAGGGRRRAAVVGQPAAGIAATVAARAPAGRAGLRAGMDARLEAPGRPRVAAHAIARHPYRRARAAQEHLRRLLAGRLARTPHAGARHLAAPARHRYRALARQRVSFLPKTCASAIRCTCLSNASVPGWGRPACKRPCCAPTIGPSACRAGSRRLVCVIVEKRCGPSVSLPRWGRVGGGGQPRHPRQRVAPHPPSASSGQAKPLPRGRGSKAEAARNAAEL